MIAGFLDRVWCAIFSRTPRLRFFHFDSIFDFAHQRQTLDTSFGGALRFGGVAFPVHRTSQLTLNLKPTKTRLERIRSNLATDDVAGNNACMEVLLEATFRQPRADPHEFGPWLNLSDQCTLASLLCVFWCGETAVRKRCSGVPSRAYSDC